MFHQRKARMGEQEAEGSHPSKIAHPLTCTLGLSQFSDSDQPTEEVVCFLLLFFRRREPTPPWQDSHCPSSKGPTAIYLESYALREGG